MTLLASCCCATLGGPRQWRIVVAVGCAKVFKTGAAFSFRSFRSRHGKRLRSELCRPKPRVAAVEVLKVRRIWLQGLADSSIVSRSSQQAVRMTKAVNCQSSQILAARLQIEKQRAWHV